MVNEGVQGPGVEAMVPFLPKVRGSLNIRPTAPPCYMDISLLVWWYFIRFHCIGKPGGVLCYVVISDPAMEEGSEPGFFTYVYRQGVISLRSRL